MGSSPPNPHCLPVHQDLPPLPRGDFRVYDFFAPGVCWTEVDPTLGEGGVTLPEGIEWVEHYWWAEARRGIGHALRFHNGWVPWYGNPPSTYVWWVQQSLGGVFWVTSSWDAEREGTVVHMEMKSDMSGRMQVGNYAYSVRSGEVKTRADDEDPSSAPMTFFNFVTWGTGNWRITEGVTLLAPPPSLWPPAEG